MVEDCTRVSALRLKNPSEREFGIEEDVLEKVGEWIIDGPLCGVGLFTNAQGNSLSQHGFSTSTEHIV